MGKLGDKPRTDGNTHYFVIHIIRKHGLRLNKQNIEKSAKALRFSDPGCKQLSETRLQGNSERFNTMSLVSIRLIEAVPLHAYCYYF